MSDLWQRCRERLRARLDDETWRRWIAPLASWMESGRLYLWLEREAHDFRSLPVDVRAIDDAVRQVAREVWGRTPRSIEYLDRPPDREHVINARRIPEERRRQRRLEDDHQRLYLRLRREEYERLRAELTAQLERGEPALRSRRGADLERYIVNTVDARARARLERVVSWDSRASWRPHEHAEPPRDPPPGAPHQSARSAR